MASMLKYKCGECGHKFELESPPLKSVECPACSGGNMHPGGKKNNIVAIVSTISGLAVVILGLLVVLALVTSRARERECVAEEDRRLAEEQLRMEEVRLQQALESEQRLWGNLIDSVSRGKGKVCSEADYMAVLKKIDDYVGGDPEDMDQLRLKLEGFKDEDVKAILSSLEDKAKPFEADKDYVKAAAMFQDYRGDYEEATRDGRRYFAEAFLLKAAEVREAQSLAEQKAREEREAAVSKLASDLLSRGIPDSVAAFKASGHADELPEISGMLAALSKVNETILDTFAEQAEQEVQVVLRSKKLSVLVKGVEDGQVVCEYTVSNVRIVKKLGLRDFDEMEIMHRLASKDRVSADLLAGVRAATQKLFELAEKHFQNLGQLSTPLLSELGMLKEEHEAAITVAAVQEDKPPKEPGSLNPSRIRVDAKVSRAGKNILEVGEVEEKLNLRLQIVNATGQEMDGFTLVVAVIGESVLDKRRYKIIETFQEVLKIPEKATIERIHPVTNVYNQGALVRVSGRIRMISAAEGYKYHSWLWVIKDPAGKIQIAKARNSRFEKNAEAIISNPDAEIDQNGSVLKPRN